MILSFGYRNGIPTFASKKFDVRDLTHDTNSDAFKTKQKEIIDYGRKHPDENLCIGCVAGKHRSVVLARKAASVLRVSLHHRDSV